MKRKEKTIQRITYTITEAEIQHLIKEYSHHLSSNGCPPVFARNTTIERIQDGGYCVCTEYDQTTSAPEKDKDAKG